MNEIQDTSYEPDIMISPKSGESKDDKSLNGGNSRKTVWNFFGRKFPKSEFIFFAQTILIYIVVSVSLYNLTNPEVNKNNEKLWIIMLSSSVGYILPNPSFRALNS